MPDITFTDIAIFVIVSAALIALANAFVSPDRPRQWKGRGGRRSRSDPRAQFRGAVARLPEFDAAEQLRCVMGADFGTRRLLNPSEARVFLSASARSGRPGFPGA